MNDGLEEFKMIKSLKSALKSTMLAFVLTICMAMPVMAESNNYTNAAIPPEAAEENEASFTLKHKIYIENYANGSVSYVDLEGKHTVIGTVSVSYTHLDVYKRQI